MTDEERVLLAVVKRLEALGIPYMVAGSVASSHHGRPRSTHDADIVIDPTPAALFDLVRQLVSSGLYADESRARDALRRRTQFNVVDAATGWKVDLILMKERAFSREEFGRRRPAELVEGSRVAVATPEDTILSKLEWARKTGGSEKQMADAAGVREANPDLDIAYVERWAAELGVLDLWRQIGGR